jgi:hypothetical protein
LEEIQLELFLGSVLVTALPLDPMQMQIKQQLSWVIFKIHIHVMVELSFGLLFMILLAAGLILLVMPCHQVQVVQALGHILLQHHHQ